MAMTMDPLTALELAERALDTIADQRDNALKDRDRATLTLELLQRDLALAEARIEDLDPIARELYNALHTVLGGHAPADPQVDAAMKRFRALNEVRHD